jgi:hypothetical protein
VFDLCWSFAARGPVLRTPRSPFNLYCRFASQLDKATADAAEFKAGFDKAVCDNFEQKAQVGSCALYCVLRPVLCGTAPSHLWLNHIHRLLDAPPLHTRSHGITRAASLAPQLDKATADAAEFKAGFDKMTADAAEFKAGFDKLVEDNYEQKNQVGGG